MPHAFTEKGVYMLTTNFFSFFLVTSKKRCTFVPEHLAVPEGVRLALYAEVAARCCWSWATGYLAQLLHFNKFISGSAVRPYGEGTSSR